MAEAGCVFTTAATPNPAIWFISRHDQDLGYVEMLKVVPEVTVCKLTIELSASAAGCEAAVTYSHTSLGPQGDSFVAAFTEEFYATFMRDWEARMNHYLNTGQALKA